MKIDILTLFPEMFEGFLNTSIIKRAQEKKLVAVQLHISIKRSMIRLMVVGKVWF